MLPNIFVTFTVLHIECSKQLFSSLLCSISFVMISLFCKFRWSNLLILYVIASLIFLFFVSYHWGSHSSGTSYRFPYPIASEMDEVNALYNMVFFRYVWGNNTGIDWKCVQELKNQPLAEGIDTKVRSLFSGFLFHFSYCTNTRGAHNLTAYYLMCIWSHCRWIGTDLTFRISISNYSILSARCVSSF